MKKNVLRIGVLFGVSIFSIILFNGKAMANNTICKKICINLNETWEEIKQEDGLIVYYTLVEENGNKFLKVKFENTTTSVINFKWTLKNDNKVIVSEKTNKIEAGKSIEIYDASMLIPFLNGDSFQNYSILISKK